MNIGIPKESRPSEYRVGLSPAGLRRLTRRGHTCFVEHNAGKAAGFSDQDLSVEVRENALIVSARKSEEDEPRTYLHRGIATRAFERRFHLADHVQVTSANHVDGMLNIDLVREVPEALKPRQIEITSTKRIEKDVVDAKSVN